MYRDVPIGNVRDSSFRPHTEKYKDRVHWNKTTGYFSLSGLRLEDSGVYNVQNDGQKSVSTFSLTAWNADLQASDLHQSAGSSLSCCSLQCEQSGRGCVCAVQCQSETFSVLMFKGIISHNTLL
uniref:Immunoglobulin V-set domain-containing protein n=1 Tax=Anguilla anguilla TaxID=7936 RepID=A0A0E9XUR9_ANGAN